LSTNIGSLAVKKSVVKKIIAPEYIFVPQKRKYNA